MTLIAVLIGSFMVFILCLILAQSCYFSGGRWLWFWLAVVCVVISAVCITDELYQWLAPPPAHERFLVAPPTTAL